MTSAGAGWPTRCQRKSPEIRSAEPRLGSAACGVQDGSAGRTDLGAGQQAAEEQVAVIGQLTAQSVLVVQQGRGIGQLIHIATVCSGC